MQSINLSALDGLTKDLDALLEKMPEKNRELHEQLADLAKQEVDAQILASGVNDSNGTVRGWQQKYVGSSGGYAAVRPADTSGGSKSPGAVTNYLELGHPIRKPGGAAKRYRPAIKKSFVDGFHFYRVARASVESKAIELTNRFADDLVKELGR